METQLIHTIPKNETEEIRISLREYKDRYYVDLRLFFFVEEQGEMLPSKKGLTVGIEFLPELFRGIQKVKEGVNKLHAKLNDTFKCTECKLELKQDDIVWVDDTGKATTGDNGKPYCIKCCPQGTSHDTKTID